MKNELRQGIEIVEIKNPFQPKKEIQRVPLNNGTICAYIENMENKEIFWNGYKVLKPEECYPQEGDQLVILPQVGKSAGQILGWAAMIALTVYTTGASQAWFGASRAFGPSLIRALATGAVVYIGGKIINSIFHLNQENDTSKTYTWNLPQIQTAEGGVIGETYGECMPSPQLLEYHVETTNSDDQDSNVQYLNMLLCGGWGPIDSIDDIRIDYTPIENFSDVTIEKRYGTNDQEAISFFPNTVLDQSIEMQTIEGKSLIRTTETDKTQRLDVTMQWPNGLYYVNSDGGYDSTTVSFKIEYKLTTDTIWTTAGVYSITKNVSSAVTRTYTIADNLAAGQYDVRVTGVSIPKGTTLGNYTVWSLLTSWIYDGAKTHPNKVLVALRIKATNQLSGSLPNVNWRQTRNTVYVWDPDAKTYVTKNAYNPIWAAYDILHQCRLLKNVNTGQYEYSVLGDAASNFILYWNEWIEAAAYAEEQIVNNVKAYEDRFRIDAFFDTAATKWTQAQKAAGVARSTIIRHGTQYGVVTDKPGNICQVFGEGRSLQSTFKGEFNSIADRAKLVQVVYNDENNNFKNTPMEVYSPTYAENLSVLDNKTKVTLFGVKRRTQAYREALYMLATNERQLQMIQHRADVEGLVCQYGDIIGINSAVAQIGMASGRIVSISGTTIILDKQVTLEANTAYGITIVLSATDAIITKEIVQVAEDTTTNTITVASAYDAAAMPEKYDCYAMGLENKTVKPFRILKIMRNSDLQVDITASEYDEAVYDVDYSRYPDIDYSSGITLNAPKKLSLSETNYMTADGMTKHILTALWTMPSGSISPDNYSVYYSSDGVTWKLWTATTAMTADITDVNPPGTYYVKVCASKDGINSEFTTATIQMTGADAAPPDVDALDCSIAADGSQKYWWKFTYPAINDIAGFRLKHTQANTLNWDLAEPLNDGLLTSQPYETSTLKSGTHTVLIKAVDNAGNESDNFASCTVNLEELTADNILYNKILGSANDWSDWTLTNCLVGKEDKYLHSEHTASFWHAKNAYFWEAADAAFWKGLYPAIRAVRKVHIPASGNFWLKYEATGPIYIYWGELGTDAFWKTKDTAFWKGAQKAFWGDSSVLKLYSGKNKITAGNDLLIVITSASDSAEESILQSLTLYIDTPDVSEKFTDIVVPVEGTTLDVKTADYETVYVQITSISGSSGQALHAEVIENNPCKIKVFDATGNAVPATINCTWYGFSAKREE